MQCLCESNQNYFIFVYLFVFDFVFQKTEHVIQMHIIGLVLTYYHMQANNLSNKYVDFPKIETNCLFTVRDLAGFLL